MSKLININSDWKFIKDDVGAENAPMSVGEMVNLPHTWNGDDGQDGGDDYVRARCWYVKNFARPELKDGERLYIEFKAVNSSAEIWLNGVKIAEHDGGYSAFRADATDVVKERNTLCVCADNVANERVYPQRADFTFYGGIYRDVNLIVAPANRFDLGEHGANPLKVTPKVNGANGSIRADNTVVGEGEVKLEVYDANGKLVGESAGEDITIENVHLWNGIKDPYLYKVTATLTVNGEVCDTAEANIGFRTFKVDPKKGFFLNGKSYPLRGVSRHQDRPHKGNAISKADHEEDMEIIREIGANTIRLAHYQHDDYFYALCDKYGLVVWAEIPYISRHMNGADENAVSQMTELILQQYNHPCIMFWGVSNEITMMKTDKKDMLEMHHKLNDLCHKLDPTRLTTLACFAMCSPPNKSAHITDVVAWNLYLGWYVPGLFLNDVWLKFFKLLYPNRAIGYSEYGAEGMPGVHPVKPKRFDNSEEYQAIYHEYLLEFFARNPSLWCTYVWNMYDFASDGRNQGGDPDMNHKILLTFDRKTKKDAFYAYKVYWSDQPVLHLCGKRYVNRTGEKTDITIYSNLGNVEVYNNGKLVAKPKPKKGGKVYKCKIALEAKNEVVVKSGDLSDRATFIKVATPDPAYQPPKGNSMSWEKKSSS